MTIAQRVGFAALSLLVGSVSAAPVDYTGFWKESCSDPYGLQIKPFQGQYTVTFCGPGGCGTPDLKAATTIEGDKNYEVLGPGKIKIKYAETYAPVYTKCTTETNPVLEYSAADRAEARRGIVTAAVFHVAYLFVAVLAYVFVHRRTGALSSVRRRAVRSGVAALLFSPGIYLTWPFVNPTFALLAFIFTLITITPVLGMLYFSVQTIYSLGPILVVWALLFIIGHIRSKHRTHSTTGHGA